MSAIYYQLSCGITLHLSSSMLVLLPFAIVRALVASLNLCFSHLSRPKTTMRAQVAPNWQVLAHAHGSRVQRTGQNVCQPYTRRRGPALPGVPTCCKTTKLDILLFRRWCYTIAPLAPLSSHPARTRRPAVQLVAWGRWSASKALLHDHVAVFRLERAAVRDAAYPSHALPRAVGNHSLPCVRGEQNQCAVGGATSAGAWGGGSV